MVLLIWVATHWISVDFLITPSMNRWNIFSEGLCEMSLLWEFVRIWSSNSVNYKGCLRLNRSPGFVISDQFSRCVLRALVHCPKNKMQFFLSCALCLLYQLDCTISSIVVSIFCGIINEGIMVITPCFLSKKMMSWLRSLPSFRIGYIKCVEVIL